VYDPAFEGRSCREGSAPEPNRLPPPQLDMLGRATVARRPLEQLPVEPIDVAVLGTAQQDRTLDQGLQDRLDVEGGAANQLQDFARSRLLLQRLRQLAVPSLELREQAHVFDRDHRLGGECLRQLDLLVREGLRLTPSHDNDPNGYVFA
jgi:hypothetical protein